MRTRTLFLWLLLYSLLPGVAKATGASALFAGNVVVIAVLLWRAPAFRWTRADNPVLAFAAWTIAYLPIAYLVVPDVDLQFLAIGAYLFLVPMAGYLCAKAYAPRQLADAIIAVGLVHVVIAYWMYGFLPLPPFMLAIREGTMAFRMSSVSGSLPYSGLALITFVLLVARAGEKGTLRRTILLGSAAGLTFITLFLSLQRGAWLGCAVAALAYAAFGDRRVKRFMTVTIVTVVVCGALSWTVIQTVMDVTVIADRVEGLYSGHSVNGSAVDERSKMWVAAIRHVTSVPIGLGVGQVGQATRIADKRTRYAVVLDGDYFKIASECGVAGILFLAYLLVTLGRGLFRRARDRRLDPARIAALGLMCQMIGTNVSELYYVNFLFWALCGQALGDEFLRRVVIPHGRSDDGAVAGGGTHAVVAAGDGGVAG